MQLRKVPASFTWPGKSHSHVPETGGVNKDPMGTQLHIAEEQSAILEVGTLKKKNMKHCEKEKTKQLIFAVDMTIFGKHKRTN